jgi:hypothetical protein
MDARVGTNSAVVLPISFAESEEKPRRPFDGFLQRREAFLIASLLASHSARSE